MGRTENVVGWGIAGATVRIMQQYIKRQHPFSSTSPSTAPHAHAASFCRGTPEA